MSILLALVLIVDPLIGNSPLTVRVQCEEFNYTETIDKTKEFVCRPYAIVEWEPPTMNEPDAQHPNPWPLTDLTGFKIYYGTDPNNLDRVVDIPNPELKTYTVTLLDPTKKYYFSMTAYNSLRNESRRTNVISFQFP